jgi:hypothetical protein
MNSPNPAKKG